MLLPLVSIGLKLVAPLNAQIHLPPVENHCQNGATPTKPRKLTPKSCSIFYPTEKSFSADPLRTCSALAKTTNGCEYIAAINFAKSETKDSGSVFRKVLLLEEKDGKKKESGAPPPLSPPRWQRRSRRHVSGMAAILARVPPMARARVRG